MEYSLLSTILNSHFHFISFYHINAYIVKTLSKSKNPPISLQWCKIAVIFNMKIDLPAWQKGQGRLQRDPRSRPSAAWPRGRGVTWLFRSSCGSCSWGFRRVGSTRVPRPCQTWPSPWTRGRHSAVEREKRER